MIKVADQEIEIKNISEGFTKEQILSSNKYSNRRDILEVLLENEKAYSFEEVDALIDKFMKGEVK